jgi:hypothetical protein
MNPLKLEEKLKRHLYADGRSQAAVARKLGYPPDTFNKWVRGVNRMPDGVIAEFCTLLRLSPTDQAELLNLAGYTAPAALFGNGVTRQPSTANPATAGLVFATKITPEGRALDPGTAFAPNIADLYAVFRPDSTIPGTIVNVDDPDPAAHYAYLRISDGPTISRLGWRWYYDGEVVNEFEMDVRPGNIVWLQCFSYENDGIFCAPPFGLGEYRIVILLGGNPALSSRIVINEAV